MKFSIISAFITSFFLFLNTSNSYAGNCDYSWQKAADGSRCGKRAADQRSGGRP